MSSSEEIIIDRTISAEWWWIAAIVSRKWFELLPKFDRVRILERTKQGYTAAPFLPALGDIGTITFNGSEGKTEIHVATPQSYYQNWQLLLDWVEGVVEEVRQLRRWTYSMTAEGAIEYYYRSRSQGTRVTLKELAKRTGYSETHLKRTKVAYDKAGKWGSKKNLK